MPTTTIGDFNRFRQGVWPALKASAIPLALMSLALLLRTYHLEQLGWVPDTYDRLFDARHLAAGERPVSTIYPPGSAVTIAPFFIIFPGTLATMQAVIIGSSVALVALSYFWMLRLTRDRLAAALIAIAAAASPLFVFASRDAFFDMINVLLIAFLLFTAPEMKNRGMLAFVGFGALLALLVNIRPTSGVLLPAILLLWLNAEGTRLDGRDILHHVLSPRPLAALGSFLGLCLASVVFADWFGGASNAPVTLGRFLGNAWFYFATSSYGVFAVCVLPLGFWGLLHLWRTQRVYAWVFGYLFIVWPLAHAPFDFANYRYMLPTVLFVFFVAAIGASSLLRNIGTASNRSKWKTVFAVWCLVTLSLQFVAGTTSVLANWDKRTPQSDAGLAREFEPAIREIPEGSLVVSAVARALRDFNDSVQYYDLVDHHLEWGVDDESLAKLAAEMEQSLADGHRVYYLYSHWEAGHDFRGRDGKENYVRFYEAISSEFALTEIQHSKGLRVGLNPWILYAVEPLDSDEAAEKAP